MVFYKVLLLLKFNEDNSLGNETLLQNRRAKPGVTFTCARIRHLVKDPSIQHERAADVYSAYSSSRECQIGNRKDSTGKTQC